MDRGTDRQTDRVIPIYPQTLFAGGIITCNKYLLTCGLCWGGGRLSWHRGGGGLTHDYSTAVIIGVTSGGASLWYTWHLWAPKYYNNNFSTCIESKAH